MKILWITNTTFPEANSLLSGYKKSLRSSGGWMVAGADSLASNDNVHLAIVSIADVKELVHLQGRRMEYYLIPKGSGNQTVNHEYEPFLQLFLMNLDPILRIFMGLNFHMVSLLLKPVELTMLLYLFKVFVPKYPIII